MSKFNGYEDLFSEIIARSCIYALPANATNFNNENVRVNKILGG